MTGRAMRIFGTALIVVAALGLAALAGYRLGRDTERAAAPAPSTAAPGERSETADGLRAYVGETGTVLVSGMRFQPEVTRIKAGRSVAWVFNDPGLFHSVTAIGGGEFDSGPRASGTFVVRFD